MKPVVALFGGPLDGSLARPKREDYVLGQPLRLDGHVYRDADRRDSKGRPVYEYAPEVSA